MSIRNYSEIQDWMLAAMMILISLLAGNLSAKAVAYWGSVSEEATEGNRFFSFFGFIGMKKNRNADIRMYNQQDLVSAYWGKTRRLGQTAPLAGWL